MAKHAAQAEILSYGIYEQWHAKSRELPQIRRFTTHIPALEDIEFGMIVQIKKAKGSCVKWRIDHPNITDKRGRPMTPFVGEEFIRNNDWTFFLGDTLWLPLEDKLGIWDISLTLASGECLKKRFEVVEPELAVDSRLRPWVE